MTRRERKEARLEKRQEWAAQREAKATQSFAAANRTLDGIPFGQPILVGHHSEKRHRRTLEKADNRMRAAVESTEMAKRHISVAGGIQRQLDTSIFSDDHDAIEALEERIRHLENTRARMRLINKLYRKGDAPGLAALGLDLKRLRRDVAAVGYSWVKSPYESYQLSGLSKRIATDRKRIEAIRQAEVRQAETEAAGGILISRSTDGAYASVQFSEKPARETLNALREAGFWWSGGRWQGSTSKIPASVLELAGGSNIRLTLS